MKGRMTRLEGKLEKTQERLDKSEVQVADLQNRVKVLAQTSEGYRKIRHRFLDTYRRDILRQVDRQGHSKISGGNQAAHEGDAVADAELYTSGERFDEKLLVELYGLTPNQISLLGKCKSSLPKLM